MEHEVGDRNLEEPRDDSCLKVNESEEAAEIVKEEEEEAEMYVDAGKEGAECDSQLSKTVASEGESLEDVGELKKEEVFEAQAHNEDVKIRQTTSGVAHGSTKPLMSQSQINEISSQKSRSKRKAVETSYQGDISENMNKLSSTRAQSKQSRKSPRRNKDKPNKFSEVHEKPEEQGCWGYAIPAEILLKIFGFVVQSEGCLPILLRLGLVCSLWREVSLIPSLWTRWDLSLCIHEGNRSEETLKWIIKNRLQKTCQDLNVSNWKIHNVECVLDRLADACPDLRGITLGGWLRFSPDHLMFLVEEFTKLERIDISLTNLRSDGGSQSLCKALEVMNGRLTHFNIAHNRFRLAAIPRIVTALSTHCPNLVLLDLSNVRTETTVHGVLDIEKLQEGCKKLKVLRITNSQIIFNTISPQELEHSPGFPDLEQLSLASSKKTTPLLSGAHAVDNDCLQRILKKSTKLKLLDIRGCTKLTYDSLIRLPCNDLKHLFLSGCSITREQGPGLELIASKWAHSLRELDLAWANVQEPLDNALRTLVQKGSESPLVHLDLCGSSVSEEAVKGVLANCHNLNSIDLSSCRGLPRGVKRLMKGSKEIKELRDALKVTLKVPSAMSC